MDQPVRSRGDRVAGGGARAAFGAVRRQGRSLPVLVLCTVALAGAAGLPAIAAAFALAGPQFAQAWNDLLAARLAEDSNPAHPESVLLPALWVLPAVLLVAGGVGAVLQTACAVCVTTAEAGPPGARRLWRRARTRVARVAAVHVLRGTLVLAAVVVSGALCVGAGVAVDTCTGLEPFGSEGPFSLTGTALMSAPVAVLLRAGLLLAPAACAVDGLTPRAALRRSWSLMRRRAALPWLVGACVLSAGCAGAVLLLVRQTAAPLHAAVRDTVLAHVTHNTYVAYAAGALAPVVAAALLCTALALPLAHTYLTAAYLRLRADPVAG
ncbi:hypothetical protein SALBM135S_08678 [Streptomyces alboniger]